MPSKKISKISKPIVGIYGYGRFGQFWANILKKDFEVWVYNKSDKSKEAKKNSVAWVTKKKVITAPTIYFCVPIGIFEKVMKEVGPKFTRGQVVMDTCSVKEMPAKVMKKYIPEGVEIIATHPMFGPDSGKVGISGLPFIYYPVRASHNTVNYWKYYWQRKDLNLIKMSPAEHDKQAAYSQGVAHYLARIIDDMNLERTQIDVKGFSVLMDMKDILIHDTWELFNDLQQNNKYTHQMRNKLFDSTKKISYRLYPPRVNPKYIIIGIMGDKGSYTEIACREYCESHGINKYKIKYLVSSKPVLKALYDGKIDYGILAIQNAQGGLVLETINSLSEFNVKIHEIFQNVVNHCLITTPGTKKITQIASHPQALKQCKDTLQKEYPDAKIIEYVDTARAAKDLSESKFPKGSAVLAPKSALDYYDNLEILREGMQDLGKNNITDFIFVSNRL